MSAANSAPLLVDLLSGAGRRTEETVRRLLVSTYTGRVPSALAPDLRLKEIHLSGLSL